MTKRRKGDAGDSGGVDDQPPDDLTCPLCHELLHDPLRTPCSHSYCRREVRLGDFSPDRALDERARRAHPRQYQQRGCEIAQERERLAARRLKQVRLYVGNLHALRAPAPGSHNMHEWTFFVRMDSPQEEERYIEQVVVRLHPTFRPSTLVLEHPPFSVRRLGWGYFVVRADVTFRPEWGGETLGVDWLLDFSGQGGMREIEVELESDGGGASAAAKPAGPATARAAAAPAVPLYDEASSSGGEGEEEGEEVEAEGESENESYGSEHGDRGGDYDLGRFVGTGWRSPASTSASEGDPTYDPGEGEASSDGGGDW